MPEVINDKLFSFGCLPSPIDYRDILLSAIKALPTSYPDSYEVNISTLAVNNQGLIGSCVGQALQKKKQVAELIETKKIIDLSPRFIYALSKTMDGYSGEGTYPRAALQVLQKYGCSIERVLPNDTTLTHEQYINASNLTEADYKEALKYAIKNFAYVQPTENELKQGIMNGGVVITMKLDHSWWTKKDGTFSFDKAEILPLRPPTNEHSYHLVFMYKWDKDRSGKTRFWIRNSWGKEWAEDGNGYFIFDDYKDSLVEAWTFVDLPNEWQEEVKKLPPEDDFRHFFPRQLFYRQKNKEVEYLQIALKIDGTFPKNQITTGYYGDITKKAVKDFQIKYKVAPLTELDAVDGKIVGNKTLKKLNELFNKFPKAP